MAANASDDEKDKTQRGMVPPPQVKRPAHGDEKAAGGEPEAAKETPGERTSHGIAPPPKLPTPPQRVATAPPSGATPPPAASGAAPNSADMGEDEGTIIVPRQRVAGARLQRVQPPGHSATIALDRTSYVVGRSHTCDLPLYSPSASREHARLTFREAAWYVQPLGGKTVLVDGVEVRSEQRLTHKVRLQLGGDELVFFDETSAAPPPVQPARTPHRLSGLLVASAVLILAAVVLAAWWWLS